MGELLMEIFSAFSLGKISFITQLATSLANVNISPMEGCRMRRVTTAVNN